MNLADAQKGVYDRLVDQGWEATRAQALADLIRPCVRLSTTSVPDEEIRVGASKYGGAPDLPQDAPWPDDEGVPMNFVAQLDLSELAPSESGEALPTDGLLSFFYMTSSDRFGYDPEDFGAWSVFWSPSEGLVRKQTPASVLREDRVGEFPACRLDYWPGCSAPVSESLQLEPLDLNRAEYEAFFDAWIQFAPGPQMHQFFGYAMPIQYSMEENCQAGLPGSGGLTDWQCLLQVHADGNADMTWGDVGCLYFWIHNEDLERLNFGRVWMVSQCH